MPNLTFCCCKLEEKSKENFKMLNVSYFEEKRAS